MSGTVSLGLIGAGRIGRIHAQNLARGLSGCRLVAVADPVPAAAEKCAAEFGIPAVFGDYRELIGCGDLEAVLICSSTDTHARMIVEAAEAGKHVFCEKPIDLDLGRIDEALRAAAAAGVHLQVGFNRRFDPSFSKARQLIAGGRIGTPELLRVTSRDPAPPPLDYVRVSGGIFLDMTIHDFDMARFLMGEEVEELYAAGGVLVDPRIGEAGDLDTCVVTLRFRSGALGTIDNSRRAAYGYDQRVEVFGSGGMVAVANHGPDAAVVSDAGGVHASPPLPFFLERYRDSYLEEMRAFIACLLEGKKPAVTGRDGRVPVVMGLAARRSLLENRPVKIAEIDAGG